MELNKKEDFFHEDEFLNVYEKSKKEQKKQDRRLLIVKTIALSMATAMGLALLGLFIYATLKLSGEV